MRERFKLRVASVHALGREINDPGFGGKMLNAPGSVIDSSKTLMVGHSLGGWTSMLATFGDQDVFKASLTFDPAYSVHMDDVCQKQFTMKHPTCCVMSSNFVPVNIA